jgi:peptide/nickel transport system permease protein
MPKRSDITHAGGVNGAAGRRGLRRRLGLAVIIAFFLAAVFADLLAPYDYRQQTRSEPWAPASPLRLRDREGNWHLRPFIYQTRMIDPLERRYEEDASKVHPLGLFVRGDRYSAFGLVESDLHLFGVANGAGDRAPRVRLLGTDALGRDRFSRLVHAIRFSLIVAPAGVVLASLIGILIGIVSGYASRVIDTALMGAADSMLALPALVLILAARAAFPLELPPLNAGVLLVAMLSLIGWAEMARLTRGLVRSFRDREFVVAAEATGLSDARILVRHILPNIASPLITQATLLLPAFLLAEVALSFLGVGLQEPVPSLGNLLAEAGDITQLRLRPLLLLSPAAAIFVFILGVRLAVAEGQPSFSASKN